MSFQRSHFPDVSVHLLCDGHPFKLSRVKQQRGRLHIVAWTGIKVSPSPARLGKTLAEVLRA